jgi:pyruvate formate lyase activating enzyme
MNKAVWIRYVLVPDLSDAPDNIGAVARFVAPMKNVEWVEVLPFHQMGSFKWKSLGLEYKLSETAAPTTDQVQAALKTFRDAGCRAR